MVYARALRALECITHAGPSPALGTTGTSSTVECSLWEREAQGSIPWSPTELTILRVFF